jgi:hypothetical protein
VGPGISPYICKKLYPFSMEAIFEIPYSLARETSEEIEIYFAGMVWMGGRGG